MDRQKHVSPDGKLCLIVETDEGDRTIGFEGYSWHTHGDILASLSGLAEESAVEKFVEKVVSGESVITVLSKAGNVIDIWTSDNPRREAETLEPGETIQFRLWDGTIVPV